MSYCKNCIHWVDTAYCEKSCEVFGWISKADDFCSYENRELDKDTHSLDNVVGKTIYRIKRYKKQITKHDFKAVLIDFPWYLTICANDPEVELVVEERKGTKSDLTRMGDVSFFTREEAEAAIEKARK